jgi:hypothetical protein
MTRRPSRFIGERPSRARCWHALPRKAVSGSLTKIAQSLGVPQIDRHQVAIDDLHFDLSSRRANPSPLNFATLFLARLLASHRLLAKAPENKSSFGLKARNSLAPAHAISV